MRSIFTYMNYEIDQQKLSERILRAAKIVAVPAGLYIFLSLIIISFIYLLGFSVVFGSFKDLIKISDPKIFEEIIISRGTDILILNTLISIFLQYMLSGIYGMLKTSEQAPFVGLGSAYKAIFSIQGLKVFNAIIVVQLVISTISYFLNLTGFGLVGFAIGILIQFLTYFLIPALYIDNRGILEGLKFSTAIVNQKPGLLFLFMSLTYLLSLSGIIFFGFGIIFTLPLNYIVAYQLYLNIKEQSTR